MRTDMKGSQELIAFFNKREEELGEKASKLCMFLEGYAEGYRDTKDYMIDKAKRAFCSVCGCKKCTERNVTCDDYKEFVKYIEK